MPITLFRGANVALLDDTDPSIVYTGSWTRQSPSPGNYANTVSETTVVGDIANFTFTGTWISVYGARSPSGTEKSTYAVDGGLTTTYFEASVVGSPKHKAQFFNSSILTAGTHTLVITNYGDSLLLDFFLMGLQDDVVTSETVVQPPSSIIAQPSQATSILTTTETISPVASSPGPNGLSAPHAPFVPSSLASASSSSAQGATTPGASHLIADPSSNGFTTYIPPTGSPSGDPSHHSSSDLSKGASAGIAVGISVFCLIVGGGILAYYCLSRRRRRRASAEISPVPAFVVTEYPSVSPFLDPVRSTDEKHERRFSDVGTSVFSLPPYGYTSHDPQVPTGSDIDDGLVPFNGLVDSKPPLPPTRLSPLRRASTSNAPPQELPNYASGMRPQDGAAKASTLAPLRGRWD